METPSYSFKLQTKTHEVCTMVFGKKEWEMEGTIAVFLGKKHICSYPDTTVMSQEGPHEHPEAFVLWLMGGWRVRGSVTKPLERKNIKQRFWLNMAYANLTLFKDLIGKSLLCYFSSDVSPLFLSQDWVKDVTRVPVNSQRQLEKRGNGKEFQV